MSPKMHEPMLVVDDNVEGTIVKCKECGKILWFPELGEQDECHADPPPLGIHIVEGIGAVDRFGK